MDGLGLVRCRHGFIWMPDDCKNYFAYFLENREPERDPPQLLNFYQSQLPELQKIVSRIFQLRKNPNHLESLAQKYAITKDPEDAVALAELYLSNQQLPLSIIRDASIGVVSFRDRFPRECPGCGAARVLSQPPDRNLDLEEMHNVNCPAYSAEEQNLLEITFQWLLNLNVRFPRNESLDFIRVWRHGIQRGRLQGPQAFVDLKNYTKITHPVIHNGISIPIPDILREVLEEGNRLGYDYLYISL